MKLIDMANLNVSSKTKNQKQQQIQKEAKTTYAAAQKRNGYQS